MCNAWNHPPGCECPFGGGGSKGRSYRGQVTSVYAPSSDYYVYKPNVLRWRYHEENFCHPRKCDLCGAEVFFVRHNGGSVWFDALGQPWPKHACFDTSRTPSRLYYHSAKYGWNSTYGVHERLMRYAREYEGNLFGVITEGKRRPEQYQNSLNVRLANGKTYTVYIYAGLDFKYFIGELVLMADKPWKLIFISLDQVFQSLGQHS